MGNLFSNTNNVEQIQYEIQKVREETILKQIEETIRKQRKDGILKQREETIRKQEAEKREYEELCRQITRNNMYLSLKTLKLGNVLLNYVYTVNSE